MRRTNLGPEASPQEGQAKESMTSIVVISCNSIDQTRRCLQHLRDSSEVAHPTEFIFVDNGSSDGSVEFLDAQEDVRLVRNEMNEGAPRARNQGIQVARGDHLIFMDSDVFVSPGWLGRMMVHAEKIPDVGCVSCLADRAAQGQELEYEGDSTFPSISAFADQVASWQPGRARSQVFLSSFLLLVPRKVLNALGGFDERFSPWGFEDDDYSFRAHLAGFQNAVALDVFVRHEPYNSSVKQRDHSALLERNWTEFCKKWGLPEETPYGDKQGLGEDPPKSVDPSKIRIAITPQDVASRASTPRLSRAQRRRMARSAEKAARASLSNSSRSGLPQERLTLCMIVRNEEDMLGDCLQSVSGIVHDIVIVDTGSTDRTLEIAAASGAQVMSVPWTDDFSAARNVAVSGVSGGYVLILDADERLSSGAGEVIWSAIRRGGFDGARLPLYNASSLHASEHDVLFEGSLLGSGVLLPRLLRWTPDLRWTGVIHEHVGDWASRHSRWIELDAPIIHYGAVSEHRASKGKDQRNLELLRRACAENKSDPVLLTYLAEQLSHAGELDESHEVSNEAWDLFLELHRAGSAAPKSIPTASTLADLLIRRGEFERARTVLDQSVRWDGMHPNLAFLQAKACWLGADYRDRVSAEQSLQESVAWCVRASDFHGQTFDTSVIGGATDFQADYVLSAVLLALGQVEEAAAPANRCLALRPRALECQLVVAEVMLRSGEEEGALHRLLPLLDPDVPDGWILAAWGALLLGGVAEAQPMVHQAVRSLDENQPLVPHRGSILSRLVSQLAADA